MLGTLCGSALGTGHSAPLHAPSLRWSAAVDQVDSSCFLVYSFQLQRTEDVGVCCSVGGGGGVHTHELFGPVALLGGWVIRGEAIWFVEDLVGRVHNATQATKDVVICWCQSTTTVTKPSP